MPKVYVAGDQLTAAEYNQVVKTSGLYATDAGGDDTYAATFSPAPGSYADGDEFTFKPSTTNTGACTFDANGLGPKSIKKFSSGSKVDLSDGDIVSGQPTRLKYDGTDMILMSFRSIYKCGQASRAPASGTGTQNIAHGLGVIPRMIRISAVQYYDGDDRGMCFSHGNATSTSDESCIYGWSGATQGSAGNSSSAIIILVSSTGVYTTAVISAVDATNITLDFTAMSAANSAGTVYIQWEALV